MTGMATDVLIASPACRGGQKPSVKCTALIHRQHQNKTDALLPNRSTKYPLTGTSTAHIVSGMDMYVPARDCRLLTSWAINFVSIRSMTMLLNGTMVP